MPAVGNLALKRRSLFLFVSFLSLLFFITACATGFQTSAGSVVYVTIDESWGRREHVLPGADPSTFQVLKGKNYAKDRQSVYYRTQLVEGALASDFEAFSSTYARDSAHAYYQGKAIPSADPASFVPFDIQWARDQEDIYFQDRPLSACDPKSFGLLKDDWQMDNLCAYREGKLLPGSDPHTFEVLNYFFAKDANQVYSSIGTIIAGADPATFQLEKGICMVCARDKDHCYRYEEAVDCAP